MFVMEPPKPLSSGLIWVLCFCCLTTKACWVSFSRNLTVLFAKKQKYFYLSFRLYQSLKKRSIGSCSMVKCLNFSFDIQLFFLPQVNVRGLSMILLHSKPFFILKLDLIIDYVECFCRYEISWFQQLLFECKIFAYYWKRCTNLFVFLYIFFENNSPFYSEYIYFGCAYLACLVLPNFFRHGDLFVSNSVCKLVG